MTKVDCNNQTCGELIEDFMLAIGRLILNLAHRLVAFMNREDDGLDSVRYGHVPLVLSGELGTNAATMFTAGKFSTREVINGLRAMYGYEPLPEEDKPEYDETMLIPYPQEPEQCLAAQVVFLKLDQYPERAHEQASLAYDEFADQYGQYIEHTFSGLLTERYADLGKVGYLIRAYVNAPQYIINDIDRRFGLENDMTCYKLVYGG